MVIFYGDDSGKIEYLLWFMVIFYFLIIDDYGGKIYCLWCFMVIFLMVIIVGKLYSIF